MTKTMKWLAVGVGLLAAPLMAIAQNSMNVNVHANSSWFQAADASDPTGADVTFLCAGNKTIQDTSAVYTLGGTYKDIYIGHRFIPQTTGEDSVDVYVVVGLSFDGSTWCRQDSTALISDSLYRITAIDVRGAQKFRLYLTGVTGCDASTGCTGNIWVNYRQ